METRLILRIVVIILKLKEYLHPLQLVFMQSVIKLFQLRLKMKNNMMFRFAESKKKTFLVMMSATIITITMNLKASALKEREYLVKRK